jgi:hypothetical protein
VRAAGVAGLIDGAGAIRANAAANEAKARDLFLRSHVRVHEMEP